MIKILVDSASDLRPCDVDFFMPISINIDGKEYFDGVDIDKDTFYKLLTNGEAFPKTSQPSPQSFLEIFEKVKEDGDELIYFSISSALSGTYQGANIAKDMVGYDGIYVMDTKGATHMISILVDYAKKLIKDGISAPEIAEKCQELRSRIKVFAGVDTLEYLYKGGRLSKTTAAVGTIAGIKPIVTVTDDGKVDTAGKAIGLGRAMQFILDKVSSFEIDDSFPIYSLYTFGEENCESLEERLEEKGYKISERLQVGSTIGAHIGPGVYAVIFITK